MKKSNDSGDHTIYVIGLVVVFIFAFAWQDSRAGMILLTFPFIWLVSKIIGGGEQ